MAVVADVRGCSGLAVLTLQRGDPLLLRPFVPEFDGDFVGALSLEGQQPFLLRSFKSALDGNLISGEASRSALHVHDLPGLFGCLDAGGEDGVEDGARDVLDLDLHVDYGVLQDDLFAGDLRGPGYEVEHGLVVGLHAAHVLGLDDEPVHAGVLGLQGAVLADEDVRSRFVEAQRAAAGHGPLRV